MKIRRNKIIQPNNFHFVTYQLNHIPQPKMLKVEEGFKIQSFEGRLKNLNPLIFIQHS